MNIKSEINEWLDIDAKIKESQNEIKQLREQKQKYELNITNYVQEHNIKSIQTDDGKLKLFETKTSQPLTFKYVEKCLNEVLPETFNIPDIINYMKEKRVQSVTSGLKKYK
tara:strand:- start:13067 stop:13399 length:333 start_codon:yes stop_codon:yes gene_type:complete